MKRLVNIGLTRQAARFMQERCSSGTDAVLGTRRERRIVMDISMSTDEISFRDKVRATIAEKLDDERKQNATR